MNLTRWVLCLVCALGLAGCDDAETSSSDTSGDAVGTDSTSAPDATAIPDAPSPDLTASPDATDVAGDALADSRTPDASLPDLVGDSGRPDTTIGSDLGPDMTPDGSMGGGRWTWCPEATDYVGDSSWPYTITVAETADYCGLANEAWFDWQTMEVQWDEQRVRKAQMWMPPGTYQLPDQAGDYTLTLPMCFNFYNDGEEPELAGDGTLSVNVNTFGMDTYIDYFYRQPMATAAGETWEFTVYMSGQMPAAPGSVILLDGRPHDPFGGLNGELSWGGSLCAPDCNQGMEYRWFDSCHFDNYDTRRHNLTFDGGEIELDLRYGQSAASTEPGVFWAGSGTLDGTSFSSTDYWKLIYTPEHHHFTRHFMVELDTPIGNVCAIAAEKLTENLGGPTEMPSIKLYDCNLELIESRRVDSDNFTLIPAP